MASFNVSILFKTPPEAQIKTIKKAAKATFSFSNII